MSPTRTCSELKRYDAVFNDRATRTTPCVTRDASASRAVGGETRARRASSRPLPEYLARERVHSNGVDEVRRDLARAEQLARKDLLVRRNVRRDADDRELVERALHPCDGLSAIAAPGDDLRKQRVVIRRHLVALEAVRVDADAGASGLEPGREHAGRGREVLLAVLGVDAAFDRVAGHPDLLLAERERLSRRERDLLLHDVDAGRHLGHGVLDLDARVHLDEVVLATRIDEELERPDVAISDAHGGSSIIFWLRRWIEHSRSPRQIPLPYSSTAICASTWRTPSRQRSTYRPASPNDALASVLA